MADSQRQVVACI